MRQLSAGGLNLSPGYLSSVESGEGDRGRDISGLFNLSLAGAESDLDVVGLALVRVNATVARYVQRWVFMEGLRKDFSGQRPEQAKEDLSTSRYGKTLACPSNTSKPAEIYHAVVIFKFPR
ncbi:hypothetical protein CVT25_002149 [Psilocybe cyanescens]|uniref:Uncharacterized protein n=1 Tax=Psilocybe cyanescens TaxID=93625 RepID=A0A409XF28_PSICY|nr:hypothetical protein CVT25_002149 [Psilocybe cyanescens]